MSRDILIDAPQVTITPQVRKLRLGETADFKCIASGSPSPEVSWHRLNGSLPVHHISKGGQLVVSNVTLDDVGIYICRASNMEGIAESSATIALKGIATFLLAKTFHCIIFCCSTSHHTSQRV